MLYDKALAEKFEKAGMKVSVLSADGKFVELLEMPNHPFFKIGRASCRERV